MECKQRKVSILFLLLKLFSYLLTDLLFFLSFFFCPSAVANYWADSALIAATGGDSAAYLDLYNIHYYDCEIFQSLSLSSTCARCCLIPATFFSFLCIYRVYVCMYSYIYITY
jgi:hypothetical protein